MKDELINKNEKKVQIIIAAHKPYRMPEDNIYLPVHVGAYKDTGEETSERWDEGFARDDEGDNISELNPGFCELTGLYWAWKNVDADFLGLVHYRRHFCISKGEGFEDILTEAQLMPYIEDKKIFVPKKRNYYIETLYSHYAHTHYADQLDAARAIIAEKYPEYVQPFDDVAKRTWGYMFNMMIMKRELADQYCGWLFDILFTLKDRYAAPDLSQYQSRFYGRLSEILFNVWLEKQKTGKHIKDSDIMELGLINLEGESWGKKIPSFLKAKFLGKKYDSSF